MASKTVNIIRAVVLPGVLGILVTWLLQTSLGELNLHTPSWLLIPTIPLTRVPLLIHWDMLVSFAVTGALLQVYGHAVGIPYPRRLLAAFFPIGWQVMIWAWLLAYPLPPWIDPARPPYRFLSQPWFVSVNYWIIHIILPSAAMMAGSYLAGVAFTKDKDQSTLGVFPDGRVAS
jgi:hypothetical protein